MRLDEFLDDLDDGGWEEGENKFFVKNSNQRKIKISKN